MPVRKRPALVTHLRGATATASLVSGGTLLALALAFVAATPRVRSQEPEESVPLPPRAVLAFITRDESPPAPAPATSAGTPQAASPAPPVVQALAVPPGTGYCAGGEEFAIPSPPNSVFGLLTISGEPAPAGTLVTLTFDGQAGPSVRTREAGGYRVDYAAGGQGHEPRCINEVGSRMGLLVGGVLTETGVAVGEPGVALRFDLALP